MDDELSSGSSPLPDLSPLKNNMEAESRKRSPAPFQLFCQCRASPGTKRNQQRATTVRAGPQKCAHVAQGCSTTTSVHVSYLQGYTHPHMLTSTTVRGPEDMLSSLLGQHILSYEPPRGFVIPSFAMYDGSSDPYDHMLHFNQAMILNAGDDCLLCKAFQASLKGLALAWFHKLPQRSINSFSDL